MTCNRLFILKNTEKLILGNPRISLLEISEILAVERHTIESAATELVNLSFRTWRQAVVMVKAAEMLIDSDILIKQLAAELGNGSARAFSRAFREHVNTSPGRYRRHPHPVPAPPKLENLPEMSSFPPQM